MRKRVACSVGCCWEKRQKNKKKKSNCDVILLWIVSRTSRSDPYFTMDACLFAKELFEGYAVFPAITRA